MDEHFTIDVEEETPSGCMRRWQELLRRRFFGLDCEAASEDFRGTITGRQLKRGSVVRFCDSRQLLRRTPALIGHSAEATVAIATVSNGRLAVEQNGRGAAIDADAFCLFDDSRPFDARITTEVSEGGLLHLPKASLVQRLGHIDDVVFKSFDARDPLQRMVLNFAKGLTGALDRIDEATVNILLDQLLDFFSLYPSRKPSEARSTHPPITLRCSCAPRPKSRSIYATSRSPSTTRRMRSVSRRATSMLCLRPNIPRLAGMSSRDGLMALTGT